MKKLQLALLGIMIATMAFPAFALSKADASIAKFSLIFANNRFVKEFTDEKGMALFLLARKLTPKATDVIVLEALLEHQKKPDPIKTTAKEEKFIRYILKQAVAQHPKDPKKSTKTANKCLTYYRLAELYFPDDKDVIIGLAKLRAAGFDGSYDTALSSVWAATKKVAKVGSGKEPEEKVIDPRKFRIMVKFDKDKDKNVERFVTTRTETIKLRVTIENQNALDADGLTVETLVIAERTDRRKTYYIAAREETEDIAVKAKMKRALAAMEAEVESKEVAAVVNRWVGRRGGRGGGGGIRKTGGEYQAWLVVLRDSNGKVIQAEASDFTTKKVAEKIIEFNEDDNFNRKGEEIK